MTEIERAVLWILQHTEWEWYTDRIPYLMNREALEMANAVYNYTNSVDGFSYEEALVNAAIVDGILEMVCLSLVAHQNVLSYEAGRLSV
jgi:hypothetical protein